MENNEGNKQLTFEQALDKLEEIVQDLETGEAPLEEAISLFQEGMQLSSLCHNKLQTAEKQVQVIMEEDGELQKRNFRLEEDI